MKEIKVKNKLISIKLSKEGDDYISLTDIARAKNPEDPRFVIQNWMKTRFSIEFLGLWEQINNSNFKRIEFDTFKNESGSNSFTMTPQKWTLTTKAIGIISKAGRHGGTYAHKDIAFEFASWISAEFKLYLIKEFQRLKQEENERLLLGWDAKRLLTKINYKIHTDAIKEKIIIPARLSKHDANLTYATEADVLNKALFNLTAKQWRKKHPNIKGNIRDRANVLQLVCLANLENLNAEYLRAGLPRNERLLKLNKSAIIQIKSLLNNPGIKKLEK